MIEKSLGYSAHPVPERLEHVLAITACVLCGQEVHRQHNDEIAYEDIIWLATSQSGSFSV